MKEKYQDWIDSVDGALGMPECFGEYEASLTALRDFLQSLADMPDDEPKSILACDKMFDIEVVTKANRDWWRNRSIALSCMLDERNKELAAAKARIAELEIKPSDIVAVDHEGMPVYALEDQPKRPILADHPKVFGKLMGLISEAHRMGVDDWNERRAELEKLLVGE